MAPVFVGRDEEARRLEELLAGARDGAPATVLLDGEAGVGKTRLLSEFARAARAGGAFVLSGGSIPLSGGAIPYGPLTEALRLLVRQVGSDEARKLAGPAWTELSRLIADFTGDGGPPGAQTRVFGAVSRMLDHIGRHAPTVLIFEDVHWADPSTLDLIAFLTRSASDQRMLLVCTYRSGLPPEHTLRTMLAEPEFTRRIHRITLARLTGRELRRLVAALVSGPVGVERFERYVELSDGNPYFVEQLVRSDAGHAASADVPGGPAPVVPESLNELMRSRLARLGETATRVVRVAAVAGRRVSDSLLAAVMPDEAALDDALRDCLDHRVLLVEDETYVFEHALLREAAYETLSPRERRRLHAAMAEALTAEVDRQPRLLPELAYHWFAADRAPEALDAAVRAGAVAVRLRAFKEAETHYRRVLELWPRVPDVEKAAGMPRDRVLRMAADAARWAGHMRQAVDWARQTIEESADPTLYERLGSYLWEAGEVAESVSAYREADRLLAGGPPAVSARVQSALATAAVRDGRHEEALRLARRATEEALSVGARPEEGRALNSTGLALTMLGRCDEGEAALRAALLIAKEVNHLEDLLRAYGNLGVCLERAGDMTGAVEAMLEGLDTARAHGVLDTRRAGVLANNAGVALFRLGRWAEATALLTDAVVHRPPSETIYLRLTKADIDVACGRFAEAERLLDEIRTHPITEPRFVASLYSSLAELAMWRGDLARARQAAAHGIDAVARAEDPRALLQLCATGLRIAADTQDDAEWAHDLADTARQAGADHARQAEFAALSRLCVAEEARVRGTDTADGWHAVATAWSDLAWPYPRAYALTRVAELAARTGDKRGASAAARTAHSIATELGARPLLAQVDGVVRRHRLSLTETPEPTARPFGMTDREWDVLREAADGLTNAEIARKLVIAASTVSVHLSNLYKKLDVGNRTEAVAKARRHGLLRT